MSDDTGPSAPRGEAAYQEALERLEQQIAQNERWITVGRLVAALCHDITNRMQAAQGALSLAGEEPGLSSDVRTYLGICQEEARRVNAQVQRMRSIYHPEGDLPGPVDVAELVKEACRLAADGSRHLGVEIEPQVGAGLPAMRGRVGQMQFVLLGLLVNISDLLAQQGGGHIWVQARPVGPTMQIEIAAEPRQRLATDVYADTEAALGVPTLRQAAGLQNGELGVSLSQPGLAVWFTLPMR